MRKILFACAVLISMPVVPAAGEPLVRMHTSHYYIDGPSATVLATQLDWTKFVEALQRHENGHKAHGLKAGKEIEVAVLAVKPASNCEDLGAAANAAADAIVAKYQALDEGYDRNTDHGRKQGATLL